MACVGSMFSHASESVQRWTQWAGFMLRNQRSIAMSINFDDLRFPTGRTVLQAKKDASRLSRERGITHTEALDLVCEENGCAPPWQKAIEELKKSGGYAYRCYCCGDTSQSPHNPLLVLNGEFADSNEGRIHRSCAHRNRDYGFCWCCGDDIVYFADDLNEASECSEHEGESVPDYPEDDEDSFIEYVQNHS